jgi:hypothetical protein
MRYYTRCHAQCWCFIEETDGTDGIVEKSEANERCGSILSGRS